jgi:hypothetical protein
MNAKMGPIVQFLGGPNANISKTFQIKWPDEGGKGVLASEIQEKPGSKASHKTIKAS